MTEMPHEVRQSEWCGCAEMAYPAPTGKRTVYIKHPWHDCAWVQAVNRHVNGEWREQQLARKAAR
jgi:hypothetical protein